MLFKKEEIVGAAPVVLPRRHAGAHVISQKKNLAPTWICRGPVELAAKFWAKVVTPNRLEVAVVFGLANMGVLVALFASARSSKLKYSLILKILNREIVTSGIARPRNLLHCGSGCVIRVKGL